eukprot:192035_1
MKLILFISMNLLYGLDDTFACNCFGIRCGKKVHPEPIEDFDNSLSDPVVGTFSSTQTLQLDTLVTSFHDPSARSIIDVAPQPQDVEVDDSSVSSIVFNCSYDIQWFDIDSKFISENNQNKTMTTKISLVLTNVMAYDITHYLFFIGHYLPLNQLTHAIQFQRVFNYFAQFRNGVSGLNFKKIINDFPQIREKLINIGTQWDDHVDVNVLHELSSQQTDAALQSARLVGITNKQPWPKPRPKKRENNARTRYFWDTNWLKRNKTVLHFNDLDPKDKHHQIKVMIKNLVLEVDKWMETLTGRNDHPSGFGGFPSLLKLRKACHVSLVNYFKKAVHTPICVLCTRKVMVKLLTMSDAKRKIVLQLRHTFIMETPKFLLSSWKSLNKHGARTLDIRIMLKLMKDGESGSDVFVWEAQFDSHLFGDHKKACQYLQMANHFMRFFLTVESPQMLAKNLRFAGFSNIDENWLFLLNVILQFAGVGGRCGYFFDEDNQRWNAKIVCKLSMAGLNKGTRVKIPPQFIELNEFEWVMVNMTDVTYQDIEDQGDDNTTAFL